MDIVYIVGGISNCDWADFRCALRSLSEYGRGIDRVFVIGSIPEWLSEEAIAIPFKQPYPSPSSFKEKHQNLLETLRFISTIDEMKEEFIIGFSDIYLTESVDFNEYPYYAKLTNNYGIDLPRHASSTEYSESLLDTRRFLESHELPARYMTMHRFLRMSLAGIKNSSALFDEIISKDLSAEPFVVVGNVMIKDCGIVPQAVRDYKISAGDEWWKSSNEITDCFSTRGMGYGPLLTLLNGKYDKKSKYEK